MTREESKMANEFLNRGTGLLVLEVIKSNPKG